MLDVDKSLQFTYHFFLLLKDLRTKSNEKLGLFVGFPQMDWTCRFRGYCWIFVIELWFLLGNAVEDTWNKVAWWGLINGYPQII